jgi:tRNA (mo5U34)-methyltransferase
VEGRTLSGSAERIDPSEVRERIASVGTWRHTIEVAPGISTPGTVDNRSELDRLHLPAELAGKRVLDVGCSDGFYSFTCEQRGADVVALDDESSLLAGEGNGFTVARELLGSKVDYRVADVETLGESDLGLFDLVLFVNVLYHVQNPQRALHALAAVTRPGGRMVLKTIFRNDVRVWVRGRPYGFDFDRKPKWWYFPTDELGGDPTNWWAPNRAGLVGMLEATGWRVDGPIDQHGDRLYLHALRIPDGP